MLLSRTRQRLVHKSRLRVFKALRIDKALGEERTRELEAHMGFRGQWDEHRRFQFEHVKAMGLKPAHRLLEIGCGPLTLGLPVINYLNPGCYTGVDVRPEVLDLALQEIGENGLSAKNPRLVLSTSFGANELGDERFDFAWSFSVLYHLSDDLLHGLMAQMALRLAPDGQYFANINIDMDEGRWLQFPFVRRPLAFYQAAAQQVGLVAEDMGSLQSLGFRLSAAEGANHLLRIVRAPGSA